MRFTGAPKFNQGKQSKDADKEEIEYEKPLKRSQLYYVELPMLAGDADLLAFPSVHQELGLSASQVAKIEKTIDEYIRLRNGISRKTARNPQIPTVFIPDPSYPETKSFNEATRHLLDVLTRKQREHLERIDRFVWMRYSGVASLVQVVSADGQVPALKEIQQAEQEIWRRYAEEGFAEWRRTLDRVSTLLDDASDRPYYGFAHLFKENALWPDVVLVNLDDPELQEEAQRKWDSELEEIIEYDRHAVCFYYPMDGNLDILNLTVKTKSTGNSHLRFLTSSCWWENYRTGSNALMMVQEQHNQIEKIESEISKEYWDLDRKIKALGDSEADQQLEKELLNAMYGLSRKETERIYNEVLLPEQRRLVVESYRRKRLQTMGPYQVIEAMEELPSEIKSLIRDEFAEYGNVLEEIEQNCYRELLDLYHAHVESPRVALEDRPSYLRPSLFLIARNAVAPHEVRLPEK